MAGLPTKHRQLTCVLFYLPFQLSDCVLRGPGDRLAIPAVHNAELDVICNRAGTARFFARRCGVRFLGTCIAHSGRGCHRV